MTTCHSLQPHILDSVLDQCAGIPLVKSWSAMYQVVLEDDFVTLIQMYRYQGRSFSPISGRQDIESFRLDDRVTIGIAYARRSKSFTQIEIALIDGTQMRMVIPESGDRCIFSSRRDISQQSIPIIRRTTSPRTRLDVLLDDLTEAVAS